MKCRGCGHNTGFLDLRDGLCQSCRTREDEIARIKAELGSGKSPQGKLSDLERVAALDEAAKHIVLTTSHEVAGRTISSEVGIVASEIGFGLNILKDIANAWRDTFGGRSGTIQKALKDGREEALAQLKREALGLGADAVISLRIEYNEISTSGGSGGAILFVAAYGTAIKLSPTQ